MATVLLATTGSRVLALDERRIRVESDPPGASVSSVLGVLGETPLGIGERDVFPNRYPKTATGRYGKLVFSHPGCVTLTREVVPRDFSQGIEVRLDCDGVATDALAAKENREVPVPEPAAVTSPAGSLSERRLRQLRVLNELLADGVLSEQEERTIRSRILDRVSP